MGESFERAFIVSLLALILAYLAKGAVVSLSFLLLAVIWQIIAFVRVCR